MISITKWPCVLVANQRSGSTALAINLAKQNDAIYYIEPFEQRVGLTSFMESLKDSNKKWLVKCMIDKIRPGHPYKKLLDIPNIYKIRLFRTNTVAQVASLYLSGITKMWFGNQLPGLNERHLIPLDELSLLPLDNDLMQHCASQITNNNRFLRDADKFVFDITCRYESLNLDNCDWRKSELPDNYSKMLEFAEMHLRRAGHSLTFSL